MRRISLWTSRTVGWHGFRVPLCAFLGIGLVCGASILGQIPAPAGKLESRDKVRMIRADDFTLIPFFRMQFKLPEGVPKPKGDPQTTIEIREGDNKYSPFYVNFSSDTSAPSSSSQRYALLIIDVSGSMKAKVGGETRYEAAKSAAGAFLEKSFTPGVDYVAVVSFDSHNVESRIRAASFVSDIVSAQKQIDNLPLPDGNTGLFSATSVGLDVLDSIKKQDPSRSVTLVVLTDGTNDVKNSGDDPGLLDGEQGLAQLERKVAALQLPVTAIGFGREDQINTTHLSRIDSKHEKHLATSREVLADMFEKVKKDLVDQFQITFATKWKAVGELPKGRQISFQVSHKTDDGRQIESLPVIFDVPAFGIPGFEGSLTADELKEWEKTKGTGDVSAEVPVDIFIRRLIIFALLGAILAGLWFGMPRLVWPERYLNWQPPRVPGVNVPNVPRPNIPNVPRANMPNVPRPAPPRGPTAPPAGNVAPPRRNQDPTATIAESKVTITPKKGAGRPPASPPPPPRTRRPADETMIAGQEPAANESDPWGYDPPPPKNRS